MKIVICIKPVKSELVYTTESRLEEVVINPYDLFALIETIKIKKYVNCEVICLCMGPTSAIGMLQKAIAIGADEAILLNDNLFRGSDTVATSYVLSKSIEKIGEVNLVTCGRRTVDGETGQVVYGIAERLKYFCLPEVSEILSAKEGELKIKQVTESEYLIGCLKLPAVMSFHDFILTPPQVSLLSLKKAKKKEMIIWNSDDLDVEVEKCGLNGSKTKVLEIQKQMIKKPKKIIGGNVEEKAAVIFDMITGK